MRDGHEVRSQATETEERPELFCRMAEQVGVDINDDAGHPEAVERAAGRCHKCSHKIECEGWLDARFGLPIAPEYCPNAPYFYLRLADNEAG